MNAAARRYNIAATVRAFTGQDLTQAKQIGEVADCIMLAARGLAEFPVLTDDLAEFLRFADFLAGEAALQSIGIVPDLGSADAVYREPNCERFELTGEVI